MTESDAIEYVRLHADTDTDPALSSGELQSIVRLSAIVDKDGKAPADENWTPTYWLTRAVANAWDLRAARAVNWVDSSTDGTSLANSQAVEHLNRNAARWRRRCVGGA